MLVTLFTPYAHAQTQPADQKPAEPKPDLSAYQTFYLTSAAEQRDANDVVTDLRNMLPRAKIYYVESQDAISMRGTPDDFQIAQKVLADIDRPRKIYRVTYSITETDSGKPVGTRKVALVVVDSGDKTVLKQGSRVPIVTGSFEAESGKQNSQVQYLDVGLDIEASLETSPDGVRLHSRIAQSSLADEKSSVGVQDPVLRQTFLEGTSSLAPGKPLALGSLDLPGGTRHQEVEVVADLVQ
ncbi:MAG: hypothetical protein WBE38_10285 [Terracidiphilus sp.]